MRDYEAHIEQHPDGNEEHGVEDRAQRNDFTDGVLAKPAAADHEAREEGAERQTDPQEARKPRDPEADDDDREQKELRAVYMRHAIE